MKNAQISTEMLMAIGAAILIFFLLLPLITDKKENINNLESYISERETCIRITNAIINAYSNDITTNLTINHNATISPNLVRVNDITCTHPVNLTSNSTNHIFTIESGQVNITKKDNKVILEYV